MQLQHHENGAHRFIHDWVHNSNKFQGSAFMWNKIYFKTRKTTCIILKQWKRKRGVIIPKYLSVIRTVIDRIMILDLSYTPAVAATQNKTLLLLTDSPTVILPQGVSDTVCDKLYQSSLTPLSLPGCSFYTQSRYEPVASLKMPVCQLFWISAA